MGIKQINGKYLPDEDRLSVSISSDKDEEYRFTLSRRTTSELIKGLNQNIVTLAVREDTRYASKEVLDFKQEEIRNKVSFKAEYKPGKSFPLGEACQFIEKISFALSNENKMATNLSILLKNNQLLKLSLSLKFMRIFKEVLNKLQIQAEWNITDDKMVNQKANNSPTPPQPKKVLH
jgi:hypothetical protein